MKLKSIFFILISIVFFTACKDTEQVGSSIQPEEDLLHVYSNSIDIDIASILVDSALSKSSYLFLGKYLDSKLGETDVEFMTQIDSRLGDDGLTIPDTTVVTTSSTTNGILSGLLTDYDSNYGPITKISSPTNVKADSIFFVINYSDDFFGDSTANQGVYVYAMNKTLVPSAAYKYFTNTDVSEFCKKDTLLNSDGKAYKYNLANKNKNEIKIKLKDEFGERLAKIYQKGSTITNQADFNNFFKGIYLSHYFNNGSLIKIEVAGILLYYSYDANITTTYNGEEVVVNSADLKAKGYNPLVSSIFLSANKAVERVNLVSHPDLEQKFPSLQNQDVTYAYTPAGMYTKVNIPFNTMIDSVKLKAPDTTKVMFNSARLTLYTKTLDWTPTDLSKTPNSYMLLLHQDSVVPFFYKNKTPDGYSSFVASYNSTTESYTFDITKAVQKKLTGQQVAFSEEMVVVPIVVEQSNSVNYYRQQLWLTATMLYGPNSADDKKPRLDMIYTRRQ